MRTHSVNPRIQHTDDISEMVKDLCFLVGMIGAGLAFFGLVGWVMA